MGIKKMLLRKILGSAAREAWKSRSTGSTGLNRWLKRIVVIAVVTGIVFLGGALALLGYAVTQVSSMVNAQPDLDLLALERLITEKAIVLTEEQKAQLAPIIKELGALEPNSEQARILKEKIWAILDPGQMKTISEWKSLAETEAGKLVESGKATLTGTISQFTGIPEERVQETLANFFSWWQLNTPQEGSTDKLLNQMNSN